MLEQTPTSSLTTQNSQISIIIMNPTTTTTSPPLQTTHRRNLAPPDQDLATSSLEPTMKKHPKSSSTLLRESSGPNIKSIIKPFRNLCTSHQNTFKPLNSLHKTQFEEKPMSKSSQQSRKTTLEIEKQIVKSPILLSKTHIETTYRAKPISVSSIQEKPMPKLTHQSRKSSLEIEKQKLRASVTGVFNKDSTFSPKPSKEASFQSKPVFISSIKDKPKSKTAHQSRKSTIEIEKQKLRASINGGIDKPHDFMIEFLKKLPKEETNVSLSKSQDSGLKVAHRSEGIDLKRPSFSLVTGGRRRSFCNSQAELNDFLSCNGVKIVSVDMPQFMQIHAVDCARKTCDSLEKFTSKTLAFTLKKEFDGVYGPAWHCIVGSSFGSFVTHSVGGFMYFSMDHKIYILLFKTIVQRAN